MQNTRKLVKFLFLDLQIPLDVKFFAIGFFRQNKFFPGLLFLKWCEKRQNPENITLFTN